MKIEEIVLNQERNVTLTAYIQQVGGEWGAIKERPAVLVLPGGGYSMCSDREADPVAAVFLQAGYHAFILRYSVGKFAAWPNPLDDYEQAMTLIRGEKKWCVEPNHVCVVGFSAGGHLAACAATLAVNRPNAALLGYAALTRGICEMMSSTLPVPVETVDAKTSPCFLFAARDDYIVDINNTLDFERALVQKGIAFESHIYSFGSHGFTTAAPFTRVDSQTRRLNNWTKDALEWLDEVWGPFTANGIGDAVLPANVNADLDDYLSASCSVGYLREQNADARNIIKPYMDIIDAFIANKFPGRPETSKTFVELLRFADALSILQVDKEAITGLDKALGAIRNRK